MTSTHTAADNEIRTLKNELQTAQENLAIPCFNKEIGRLRGKLDRQLRTVGRKIHRNPSLITDPHNPDLSHVVGFDCSECCTSVYINLGETASSLDTRSAKLNRMCGNIRTLYRSLRVLLFEMKTIQLIMSASKN